MASFYLTETIYSLQNVLVALIPVGNISQMTFVKYRRLLQRFSTINLSEHLSIDTASPLKHRDWSKDKVFLNFDSRSSRSDWEELLTHKKIFAVIGIADCSVEENFQHTYEEFKYKAGELIGKEEKDERIPRSCFAFQMRPDQRDPDIEEFKPIPDQGIEHLNFYINNIIGMDFVIPLVKRWEAMVAMPKEELYKAILGNSKKNELGKLKTPLDKESEESKIRKRKFLARITKRLGDCCLLSGSPLDASMYYKQAVEECKSFNDWEWAGASLEGYISCHLIINRDSYDAKMEAFAKYVEAVACYERRKADILYIEALFKFARLHLDNSSRLEMADALTHIYEASLSLPTDDRIKVCCSIALMYKETKLMRKFAFYLRETGMLCFLQGPPTGITLNLFLEVAKEYNIHFEKKENPFPSPMKSRREQMLENGEDWIKIQSSIMKTLYDISSGSEDMALKTQILVYILREIIPKLPPPSDEENNSALAAIKSIKWIQVFKSCGSALNPIYDSNPYDQFKTGLGIFQDALPIEDPSITVKVSKFINDPMFLYRPNREAKLEQDSECFAWAGNTSYFEVYLNNALGDTLVIESATLQLRTLELIPNNRKTFDIEWNPDVEVVDLAQPLSRIMLVKNVVFNLPVKIPKVKRRKPASKGALLFLVPERFIYTTFNCHFSEKIFEIDAVNMTYILTRAFKYINVVPTLCLQEKFHSWLPQSDTCIKKRDILIQQHLQGEHLMTSIIINNEGDSPVNHINIEIKENGKIISNENSSRILLTDIAEITKHTKSFLPLKSGQSITIPLHFVSSLLGDHQVMIDFEYKSDLSQLNVWRKANIVTSFRVEDSLSVSKVSMSMCNNKALAEMDSVIAVMHDEEDTSSSQEYVFIEYDLYNGTNMGYELFFEIHDGTSRHIESANTGCHQYSHKTVGLAVRKSKFLELLTQAPNMDSLTLFHLFLNKYRLSWSMPGNRAGWVPIQNHDLDLESIKKLMHQIPVQMDIKLINHNVDSTDTYNVPCNDVIKLEANVKYMGDKLKGATLSILNTTKGLSGGDLNVTWIGKSVNMDIPFDKKSLVFPFCIHTPGTYNIIACLKQYDGISVWSTTLFLNAT